MKEIEEVKTNNPPNWVKKLIFHNIKKEYNSKTMKGIYEHCELHINGGLISHEAINSYYDLNDGYDSMYVPFLKDINMMVGQKTLMYVRHSGIYAKKDIEFFRWYPVGKKYSIHFFETDHYKVAVLDTVYY